MRAEGERGRGNTEQAAIAYGCSFGTHEGKRPLYVDPGNHIGKFFEQLEEQNTPDEVIRDYESVHTFLVELTECLTPVCRRFFESVISDPYPGSELKKRRVTRLFPNHLMVGGLPGLRDDDDLNVAW